MRKYLEHKGFTLIEIVMAVVIAGILATVAIRSTVTITETGRVEITKTELEDIGYAITGNPNLENNGIRTDFGFVGDIGAMPSSLNDLMTNPGGYATWNGPYIKNRFDQIPSDYLEDAWGETYSYSGVDITSTGSGSNIVHKIAQSTNHLLLNTVSGNIYDADGTPPGSVYNDSIDVYLTYPNGSGSTVSQNITPDIGGYFVFDSIPIGNHDISIIYHPANDTINRFVTIPPNTINYGTYILPTNYWTAIVTTGTSTLISATFDSNDEGFSYSDDIFRSTSEPSYADGAYTSTNGYNGGGLSIGLGGINSNDQYGMSGGWEIDFTLSATSNITISFYYNLVFDSDYESDEYGEVLMSVDGTLYGNGANDYIDRIYGDDSPITSGWQIFTVTISSISAGSHTIAIGGYNNKKTSSNESMDIYFDQVTVVTN